MEKGQFFAIRDVNSLIATVHELNRLQNVPRVENDENKILLDWQSVDFVTPTFTVVMAGLIRTLQVNEFHVSVLLPDSQKVVQYLANIGFTKKFFKGTDVPINELPMADHIPFVQFKSADSTVIERLTNCFCDHLTGLPDLRWSLENSFAELMENVKIHSGSKVGGFLTGQFLPKLRVIRFALCDFGISIPGHLGRLSFVSTLHDIDIVMQAFVPGVSGAVDHIRSGSGLPFVRDFTQSVGGLVRVYSRNACITIHDSKTEIHLTASPFPGTLYVIDWPTR